MLLFMLKLFPYFFSISKTIEPLQKFCLVVRLEIPIGVETCYKFSMNLGWVNPRLLILSGKKAIELTHNKTFIKISLSWHLSRNLSLHLVF